MARQRPNRRNADRAPEYAAGRYVEETYYRQTGQATPLATGRWREDFLLRQHIVHRYNLKRWQLNEARALGADAVRDELIPFSYELDRSPSSQYVRRQDQLVYLNLPDMLGEIVAGFMQRFAPDPFGSKALSFGPMGDVRQSVNWDDPSDAELIWHFAWSPGNNGLGWTPGWLDALKMAMHTGHRWIYVDTPGVLVESRAQLIDGLRPYLTEYSPIDVPDWEFGPDERLNYVIMNIHPREAPHETHKMLLTRKGFTRFGTEYAEGGWFKFREERRGAYDGGNFDDCYGLIPMTPLFFQRSKGIKGLPMISKPGTTELGNVAIALANVTSSAGFSTWKSGSGLQFLAGVDEEGMEFVNQQYNRGDSIIGIPPNSDTDATPEVYKGSLSDTNGGAKDREEQLMFVAAQLGIGELIGQTGGGENGASQSARFNVSQVPRIIRTIQHLRSAQLETQRYLCYRFGHAEAKDLRNEWPLKVDLVQLISRVQEFFTVQRLAGIRSATASAKAMTEFVKEQGVAFDDAELQTIHDEYKETAELVDQAAEQQAASLGDPQGKNLSQPGAQGGRMRNDREQARDKAREAGKKADRPGPKRNVQAPPRGNR